MNDFDLNACGVSEMNRQEMLNVDGGNIFKSIAEAVEAAVRAVGQALDAVDKWLKSHGINVQLG